MRSQPPTQRNGQTRRSRTTRAQPTRTCVGCGRRARQSELRRVARHPGGTVVVGRQQPGRGAWLCRGSQECFEAARSRGTLERALRTTIPPGEFEALRARLMPTMDAPAGD